jgi:hypothetical protein
MVAERKYHVPPALSLRSKTWILSKNFSAANAAAVTAPVVILVIHTDDNHGSDHDVTCCSGTDYCY